MLIDFNNISLKFFKEIELILFSLQYTSQDYIKKMID